MLDVGCGHSAVDALGDRLDLRAYHGLLHQLIIGRGEYHRHGRHNEILELAMLGAVNSDPGWPHQVEHLVSAHVIERGGKVTLTVGGREFHRGGSDDRKCDTVQFTARTTLGLLSPVLSLFLDMTALARAVVSGLIGAMPAMVIHTGHVRDVHVIRISRFGNGE